MQLPGGPRRAGEQRLRRGGVERVAAVAELAGRGDRSLLGEDAVDLLASEQAQRIAPGGVFDPLAMVNACQAALSGRNNAQFYRRLQQAEWELLFAHSYRCAVSA